MSGEGHITILGFSYDSIGQGTWVFGQDAAQYLNGNIFNSTDADGDNLSYKVNLDAGTYTLLLYTKTATNEPIVDFDIDAVEVASFDLYSSPIVRNVRKVETGIVIGTAGLKTLKVRVHGKNPSSSHYWLPIGYIALWRTA